MEAQVQGLAGHVPVLGEAVQDPAHLPCPLLSQDPEGVRPRLPGVDDQGLAAGTGGGDVVAKALVLPGQIPLAAVIVQAGLADGDVARVSRQGDQLVRLGFLAVGLVGVDTHRDRDLGIRVHQGAHFGVMLQIDGHAEHVPHPAGQGRGHEGGEVLVISLEADTVEMAMGVHEHSVSLFHRWGCEDEI